MITPLQLLDDLGAENISVEQAIRWYGHPQELFHILLHLQIDNSIEIYKMNEGERTIIETWEIQEILRLIQNGLEFETRISGMTIGITELGVRCIS